MYYTTLDDLKVSLRDLAEILQVLALVMLIPIAATYFFSSAENAMEFFRELLAFLAPSIVFYLLYKVFKGLGNTKTDTQTKHAMMTVVMAWFLIALVGMLPFLIRGTLGPVDSFFESMSGWATTGMTMIEHPELVDSDIIFYRSLTHLVGGVGIIALGLVVFLHTGKAASEYYGSEVGIQRIKPGIRGTVMETWKIYLLYAFAGVILYYLAGMSFFDSINHSWAAIATGGFSSKTESIGYYDSVLIELITMILMIAGSVSFLVHFRLFNGDVKSLVSNVEAKYMFWIIILATVLIWADLYNYSGVQSISNLVDSLRKSSFQAISSLSCTGFGTADTGQWPQFSQTILMMLMYLGGFYGSTAGGIKLLRLAIMFKAIHYILRRMVLPRNAIVTLRLGGKNISPEEILYVLGFSILYIIVSIVGGMGLMWLGYTGYESMELSLSAMGNVGIVFVSGAKWFGMHPAGKILLAILMWVGRLEIFPVLLLFRPVMLKTKNKID